MKAFGFAAFSADQDLAPYSFERRDLAADDVAIDILYCGICHTDLHQARNDWGTANFPVVPGHEIVGRVRALGPAVKGLKIGDAVAVGCMVDSCLTCDRCEQGDQQLCRHGATFTYNSADKKYGGLTFGGYSSYIVVRDKFVLRVPANLDLKRVGPILCAGITCYTPLRKWNVGPKTRVAVAGLGGLGHMGVKLAVGLGAKVTVITTSANKAKDAKDLGAHDVLLSTDPDALKARAGSFDFILDTIPVAHDFTPYINLLDADGSLVVVGALDMAPPFHSGLLVRGRKSLSGSLIGGIERTQELLELCAAKNILPDCEILPVTEVNKAYERLLKNDVKYRFVLDMAGLPKS